MKIQSSAASHERRRWTMIEPIRKGGDLGCEGLVIYMGSSSIVVVTLKGVPLSVTLEWPFHANVSGADFHVLHGTIELGNGSGLHAQVALHLTRVVAERLPGMEAEHTLGPVLGAIRRETDRKQLEFLRSDKRQPIPLGGRFQDFRSKAWKFEQADAAQMRQALLDRLFWAGSQLQAGPVNVADPAEALYLGSTPEILVATATSVEAEGLLQWRAEGALATKALLARAAEFEERARKAIDAIQQKHAFEQQKVIFSGSQH